MLRNCWGGWRVGGDVNVLCTCTHARCHAIAGVGGGMLTFLAVAYMVNATPLLGGAEFFARAQKLDSTRNPV